MSRMLTFVDYDRDAFVAAASEAVAAGASVVQISPWNELAEAIAAGIAQKHQVAFVRPPGYSGNAPDGSSWIARKKGPAVIILLDMDADALSAALMRHLDTRDVRIVASVTGGFFRNRPLFLISIPKAGTHLLSRLAEVFGYLPGLEGVDHPLPGYWYYIEYSNSHTSARDFFIDTVRRSPFGNRHHPFMRSPAVFIYRNPLDILVSEANYYHQDGKTPFAGYLSSLAFPERLLRLANDTWLLGSIRDRVGNFAAWLEFPNVIPVSFEELVGSDGGGDADVQDDVIWSLQLKLHVPGSPSDYGGTLFSRDAPTFHEGRIGSYRKAFTDEGYRAVRILPQDFMKVFGYDGATPDQWVFPPKRAEEFRQRPLRVSGADFASLPLAMELAYLGCNLIRLNDRFYAVPENLGPIDIARLSESTLNLLPQAERLQDLKLELALGAKTVTNVRGWIANELVPAVAATMRDDKAGPPSLRNPYFQDELGPDVPASPALVGEHLGYNLVRLRGHGYGVKQALGLVDLTVGDDVLRATYTAADLVICESIDAVIARIDIQNVAAQVEGVQSVLQQLDVLKDRADKSEERIGTLLDQLEKLGVRLSNLDSARADELHRIVERWQAQSTGLRDQIGQAYVEMAQNLQTAVGELGQRLDRTDTKTEQHLKEQAEGARQIPEAIGKLREQVTQADAELAQQLQKSVGELGLRLDRADGNAAQGLKEQAEGARQIHETIEKLREQVRRADAEMVQQLENAIGALSARLDRTEASAETRLEEQAEGARRIRETIETLRQQLDNVEAQFTTLEASRLYRMIRNMAERARQKSK